MDARERTECLARTVKTLVKGALTAQFMHIAFKQNGAVPSVVIIAWAVVIFS
jgi:hypothetical protein